MPERTSTSRAASSDAADPDPPGPSSATVASAPRIDRRLFRRELTPSWLSAAAVLAGQRPIDLAAIARVAWMGCSTPLTPAVVAAVHPQTQVLAWDPDPATAATLIGIQRGAALPNLAIREDPAPPVRDRDGFDLVVIDSVVDTCDATRRQALIASAVHLARPGAVICVTYRTEVGWGEITPLVQLLRYVAGRADRDPAQAVADALVLLEMLLERGVGYLHPTRPIAREWVQDLLTAPTHLVVADYVRRDLQPPSHARVAEAAAAGGATWIGHATLDGDVVDHGLAPEVERDLTGLVGSARSEVLRQSLTDIAVRRTNRADLFRLGSQPLDNRSRTNWLARLFVAPYDSTATSGLGPADQISAGPAPTPASPEPTTRQTRATTRANKPTGARPSSSERTGPPRDQPSPLDFGENQTTSVRRLLADVAPKQRQQLLRQAMRTGLCHPVLGGTAGADRPPNPDATQAAVRLTDHINATHPAEHRWVASPGLGSALPAHVTATADESTRRAWGLA